MVTIGGKTVLASGTLILNDNQEVIIQEPGIDLTLRFDHEEQPDQGIPSGYCDGDESRLLMRLHNKRPQERNPYDSSFGSHGVVVYVNCYWQYEVVKTLTYTIVRES